MEFNLIEQSFYEKEITVTHNDTASKYGSGLIDVFATPAMVGLMENTAMNCVADQLPEGYITLGIEINTNHQKATPVGMKVVCKAILSKVEGKKLFFELIANDEKGLIGKGTHIRYIVNAKQFMEKLKEQNL
jgi:predicted thioesterase